MIQPIFNLTEEELAMEAAVDQSSARTLTPSELSELKVIAKNTLAKNKAITIRLSERTLMRLKAAAAREGLPYQTLVASLIHKNI